MIIEVIFKHYEPIILWIIQFHGNVSLPSALT